MNNEVAYMAKRRLLNRAVVLAVATVVLAAGVWLWRRMPIVTGPLTRQTVLVMVADALAPHHPDKATLLWIDDDGGPGMQQVVRLCRELGLKATFAVIPAQLTDAQADSLAAWQREGFGIALHGLRHESWSGWNKASVSDDIRRSRQWLARKGIDTLHLQPVIVPAHAANTHHVRAAIAREGCAMVTGANIVNPDCAQPLWGRLWIDRSSDLNAIRKMLEEALQRRAFVVIGTHSSSAEAFSYEKTKAVLRMAIAMGYSY